MTAETSLSARQGLGAATVRLRRLAPSFAVSILAHALLLALVILLARHRVEAPEWLPPPAFEVVPDTGGASKPSVAAPEKRPAETPPEAAPARPPAPVPAAPPTTPPPATPTVPQAAPVTPALPEPPLPRPEAREPAAKPAIAHPAPPLAFPAPMTFSLGPTAAPSPRRRIGRGIDLSLGQGVVGAEDTRIFGRSDSKEVGPDWYNRFAAWWDRHGYYPPQAGENGQQGEVVLYLVVLRSGRVERVALVSRSGSQWLDMAALGVFRNARLPPLPADAAASVPITLKIHYQIVR
jgi:protein TonB